MSEHDENKSLWGKNAFEQAEITKTGKSILMNVNTDEGGIFFRRLGDGHIIINGFHFANEAAAMEAIAVALKRLQYEALRSQR